MQQSERAQSCANLPSYRRHYPDQVLRFAEHPRRLSHRVVARQHPCGAFSCRKDITSLAGRLRLGGCEALPRPVAALPLHDKPVAGAETHQMRADDALEALDRVGRAVDTHVQHLLPRSEAARGALPSIFWRGECNRAFACGVVPRRLDFLLKWEASCLP